MKWTLLLLLLVNIALGGYQFWVSTQPVTVESSQQELQFSNLSVSESQSARIEQSADSAPVISDKPVNRCIRITGLSQEDGLPVVTSRLKALEVPSTEREVTLVLRTDYQVILGPFPNEDMARLEMQTVSSKGIDSYVISSGTHKNALSLGVFSTESNANRKVSELFELDIVSSIVTKEHSGQAFELLIDKESAALVSDETLNSILAAYSQASFSRYSCN